MNKACFLFPGQGAQYPGMAEDCLIAVPAVEEIFDCASEASQTDIHKLLFASSEEELKRTDKSQIAITVANLAACAALASNGILPEACAGFSLGEFSALQVSGIISLKDCFHLVTERGKLMQEACDELGSGAEAPGMAAVIGLDYESIQSILQRAGLELYAANINSAVQTVVAGTHQGLTNGETLLKEAGAKRYIRLKVAGPFHSPLMENARLRFADYIQDIDFMDPVLPCYSNVTGDRIRTAAEAKELAVRQIVSPVQWIQEQKQIVSDGYDCCYETGPGKVLCGLWKYISSDIPCHPAGTMEDVQKIVKA